MGQKRKPHHKYLTAAMIAAALVVLCIAVVWMSLKTSEPEDLAEDVVIETPYCKLYYPGSWKDSLRTEVQEGDPYVVTFYGTVSKKEEHALFDIVFNGVGDFELGYVSGENDEPVCVGIVYYDIDPDADWTEKESNTIFAMQEAAGYLIDHIPLVQQTGETEDVDDLQIQTPYGVLNYPGKWNGLVKIDITTDDGYVVTFSGLLADVYYPLFDIVFADHAEAALGYLSMETGERVSVGVRTYEIGVDDDLTPEMQQRFYEMQEGLNDVLADLPIVSDDGSQEMITVETPYCDLVYSGIWGTDLYTEQIEENGYRVCFYGKTEGIEPQLLFEIRFGGDQGSLLGRLEENNTPVYLIYYEMDPEWNLTQQAIDKLYAMQEEVNVIVENLKQEEAFTPSR